MTYNIVDSVKKTDFLERWEAEVNKILSNGIIWIDKSVLWDNFCMQYDVNSQESPLISCLEVEEVENITDEELHLEVLNTFGRVSTQII